MKVLVIGCGRIGAHPSERLVGTVPAGWLPVSHIENWLMTLPRGNIAICDTDNEAVERWSSYYDIKNVFLDYSRAISSFQPDIISIATRTPEKSRIIISALKAGVTRGIYVEKPLASSLATTVDICERVTAAKCHLFYGANRRYHSCYTYAKEIIDNGTIGKLEQIIVEHGPSKLMWTHPHTADLIDFYLNGAPFYSVNSYCRTDSFNYIGNHTIDSDPIVEFARIEFEGNVQAIITSGRGHNVMLHGEKGIIRINSNGESLTLYTSAEADKYYFRNVQPIHPSIELPCTANAFQQLVQSLSDTHPDNPRHIINGTAMLMGIAWSHLNDGQIVRYSDIPHSLCVTGRYNELNP